MDVPQLSGPDDELTLAAIQAAAQAQAEMVSSDDAGQTPAEPPNHGDEVDDDVVPVADQNRGQYKSRAALVKENAELKRALAQARAKNAMPPTQQNRTDTVDRCVCSPHGTNSDPFTSRVDVVDESFADFLERERGWAAKMARYKSLPEFEHMTPEDWRAAKSQFMIDCSERQAAKRRRVEREDVSERSVVVKGEESPTFKPNIETWSSGNSAPFSPTSRITMVIPWYFSLLHPHMDMIKLGEHFQTMCIEAIKSISPSFFAMSGKNLPEVRHHHHLAVNHIQFGALLIENPNGSEWRSRGLSWYQNFLGLCLAIWFHRKADVCTRVIINRGTRSSTPTPRKTWQEARTFEVEFYSTLWGEVTTFENFEKWYKAAESSNLFACGQPKA